MGGMRRLGLGGEGDCRARENDESVLTVPSGPYSLVNHTPTHRVGLSSPLYPRGSHSLTSRMTGTNSRTITLLYK